MTWLTAVPSFPALNGYVVDQAKLFTSQETEVLSTSLHRHEQNTSNQVVVVTLNTLQGYDIADFGYQLGRHWGIGQKERDNGVLLLIAPHERKVRIEVGYGLEGALSDAIAHDIIDSKILPFFKQGEYYQGTKEGVSAILLAIEGQYKMTRSARSEDIPGLGFIVLFFLLLVLKLFPSGFVTEVREERVLPSVISGLIVGVATWLMFTLLVGTLIGIFITLMILFGYYRKDSGSHYKSTSGGFSDFGSSGGSFGGFSGGGGSFGGGGASGSW